MNIEAKPKTLCVYVVRPTLGGSAFTIKAWTPEEAALLAAKILFPGREWKVRLRGVSDYELLTGTKDAPKPTGTLLNVQRVPSLREQTNA